jgi:hypothetical protein
VHPAEPSPLGGTRPEEQGSPQRSLLVLPAGRFAAVFLALFAISILPLLCFDIPSINDYVNHLARVHVLRHPEAATEFYATDWAPVPNLAFDVVVGALSAVMPLSVAGKVFLALVFLQIAIGTVLLHRQLFNQWSLWPCVSFAFLYNRNLLSGVIGYLFGVGLCLCALTLWLRSRSWPPWQRLGVGVVSSMALFFSHFMAFGVYAIMAFFSELAYVRDAPPSRRRCSLQGLAVAALQGVPPLLTLFFLAPTGQTTGLVVFRSFWSRIEALGNPLFVYQGAFDLALGALLAGASLYGLKAGRLAVPRPILWALVALCGVHLAMPAVAMTLHGGDRRLPIAAVLLFFGGTRLDASAGRGAKAVVAAAALLFLARTAGVLGYWQADQSVYADCRSAMASVEPGSRVLPAYPRDSFGTAVKPAMAVYYLPTWEVVRAGGFAPDLFAYPTQQPVRMTPGYRQIADALAPDRMWEAVAGPDAEPLDPGEQAALACYDYVVLVDNRPFDLPPHAGLVPVVDTPCLKLLRVRRQ